MSILVGIAGGTASGKSTTARALAERLGDDVLLVTHDRYYHSLPTHHRHAPHTHNFDAPAALDTPRLVEDLQRLRSGEPTGLPRYDFVAHQREAEEDPVQPRAIILVEGILVLHEPVLRELFHHKVFVHAPPDIRLARRIRRDMKHRGRTVDDVLDQWERTVRPMHRQFCEPSAAHADLVVDGTTTTESMVASVLGLLGRI